MLHAPPPGGVWTVFLLHDEVDRFSYYWLYMAEVGCLIQMFTSVSGRYFNLFILCVAPV